jgi:hypothetical protein
MGPFGEVAREIRLPDSNKHDVAIAQQTRGVYDHEFSG